MDRGCKWAGLGGGVGGRSLLGGAVGRCWVGMAVLWGLVTGGASGWLGL